MNQSNNNFLAQLPSIDELLNHELVQVTKEEYGATALTQAIRQATGLFREQFTQLDNAASLTRNEISEEIINNALAQLQTLHSTNLKAVYNLTGTVLHTNLGRAPMPEEAIQAMTSVARGASNLEFDLKRGKRGDRDDHVAAWICRLTGAEAATVVNNNAAAVLLVLNTFAQRKEVLVSRGELIEIGGSFRIPDVMKRAGAKLQEVGTTNRTHAKDFRDGLSSKSALIMKVHTSNYKVQGFTAEVAESELASIAHEAGLPFANDLGSGTIVDLSRYGLPHEPTVIESLNAGADIVTFSGDKLLGGPQAGIIVGRADLIKKIKANPMKRALRVDKLTLAALEAVFKIYTDPDSLNEKLPALRLLTRDEVEIAETAEILLPAVKSFVGTTYEVRVVDCRSQIGSGAQPVELLSSKALSISPVEKRGRGKSVGRLSEKLRSLPTPVIGRIMEGALILDLRCLEDANHLIRLLNADIHVDSTK